MTISDVSAVAKSTADNYAKDMTGHFAEGYHAGIALGFKLGHAYAHENVANTLVGHLARLQLTTASVRSLTQKHPEVNCRDVSVALTNIETGLLWIAQAIDKGIEVDRKETD